MISRIGQRTKQRLLSIFFVLISLIGTIGMVGTTMADTNMDGIATIDRVARQLVIATAALKCSYKVENNKYFTKEEIFSGEIFDNTNIKVGAWLEREIDGKVDDGEIKCSWSVIQTFLNNISNESISDDEVICKNLQFFVPVNDNGNEYLDPKPTYEGCMSGSYEKFRLTPTNKGTFDSIVGKYYDGSKAKSFLKISKCDLVTATDGCSSSEDFWGEKAAKAAGTTYNILGKGEVSIKFPYFGPLIVQVNELHKIKAVLYKVYDNEFTAGCDVKTQGVAGDSTLEMKRVLDSKGDLDSGKFGVIEDYNAYIDSDGYSKKYDGFTTKDESGKNMTCSALNIRMNKTREEQGMGFVYEGLIYSYAEALIDNLRDSCKSGITEGIRVKLSEKETLIRELEDKYDDVFDKFRDWLYEYYGEDVENSRYNEWVNGEPFDINGRFVEVGWLDYYYGGSEERNKAKEDENYNEKIKDLADYASHKEYWLRWSATIGNASDDEYIRKTDEGGYICNPDMGVEVDIAITEPEEPGGNIVVQPSCSSSGAASSLAWIVCPVLEWVGNAAEGIYEDYVESQLQIRATLFNEGDEAAKGAWESFRAFANTIFVILLLVVVFSQVTGYGIDNYGIKKILPKLIIAAILINLSYYICVLAVDLSNIIGNGARSIFQNINISPAECLGGEVVNGVCQGVPGGAGLGSKVVTGVAVLGIVVAGIWASPLVQGGGSLLGGILIMLIMAAISVLIAVLGLFLILSIRQAAVLILTVVSPVAFVCFILPNTKKIFSKWLKFGWSLLLVYPICGLLVGGGDFASRLILSSSNNFMMVFTAMIVGIVPIFFIPTVLKNSLSAAGNIGAKISGIRRGIGKSSSRHLGDAIKKSDTFRRADNFVGRNIGLTARKRAAALKASAALAKERSERARYGNRKNMERTLAAVAAAEEAKDYDTSVNETLALMQSSGTEGGIRMENGERGAYTMDNALKRVRELEKYARTKSLNSAQQTELAALSRGLVGMKGGASKLAGIVRTAGAELDDDGKPRLDASGRPVRQSFNANFMNAMGGVYGKDSAVSSKMNEKDQAMGVYMEHFLPGGDGAEGHTFYGASADADFQEAVKARIKSHAVGLNQGGTAAKEYIRGLNATQAQEIFDDDTLLNSLDGDIREAFKTHAAALGVDRKSSQHVVVDGGGAPTPGPAPTPTPTPTPGPAPGPTEDDGTWD